MPACWGHPRPLSMVGTAGSARSHCNGARTAQAFAAIADRIREDPYLHLHLRYYVREVRVVAYSR